MQNSASVDEYIKNFPTDVQVLLEKIRHTIKKTAPQAEETISYGIPTYKLNGNLVHFGGAKKHIGFYPGPGAIEEFKSDLTAYECLTGTIKFQLHEPIPNDLVMKITEFRI